MITLLDKHGREIHDQDKIIERIEEFYSGLYDIRVLMYVIINPRLARRGGISPVKGQGQR